MLCRSLTRMLVFMPKPNQTTCIAVEGVRHYGGDAPRRPKRPLTPFMQYSVERYPVLKQSGMKVTDIGRRVGDEWKRLNEEEQSVYKTQYEGARAKYEVELEAFNSSLSEDELEALRDEDSNKRKKRAVARKKRLLKELGKPKQPPNAFALYVQEVFPKDQVVYPLSGEPMKECARKWASLPVNQKQVYTEKYNRLREKYEIDLTAWEKKIQDDYPNLVRNK